MGVVFNKSSTQYTTFQARYDGDGTVWRQAVAGANLTAKTPVQIIYNEYGAITKALADGTDYTYIGVPDAAATTADVVWLQTGGFVEDVVTPAITTVVGYALEIHDGAIAQTVAADYDGNDAEFAVCTEASTASTHDMMLVNRMIIQST